MGKKVTEQTAEIVQPILDEMKLELVDIEFEKEGKNWFLRVFIDKPGGVDIEECGQVSEQLSEKLDQDDPVTVPYYLEVSSPGAERPLKKPQDFHDHIGNTIFVSLYEPMEGTKTFEGKLIRFNGETVAMEIMIKTRKKEIEIPYQKIAKARLAVTFN
ncbi:ribosome maturation factor RimP [Paraliobacillus ryukyuensis]|uniref:Ribosome maturation factor RimP n=1 Tax=Paraliobacillus ryukyuensis TaxID=200904 RepID=A0A366EH77_9BACI|nr:ribosome maturation factor RimP [Paraliobacillus ryukyuensis]RBP01762.1 ribosome maturation factor RimP [Paraliobacillus ryukyuensis]